MDCSCAGLSWASYPLPRVLRFLAPLLPFPFPTLSLSLHFLARRLFFFLALVQVATLPHDNHNEGQHNTPLGVH